ncbi:uncharacterized protein PHALS_11314 [Plasmopara halstedii]|uniref:Uncharacterized protein n=1 Tax=Plasmopara halstedii TaxID=4781 RepID=A0A0P1AK00_PLAHL|nr:uncharacterized protein PHALS_11314 [Plasmopara halstedii]CEG41151.1 hypothetical protein PHALS_11314 [Plasmopara halstedii]|eukprot:XP_024577520.1 hypothetical protein PHALS_11314 [Plasmopara halstedii]
MFSRDEMNRFKSFAAKGGVVLHPTELDVIDEDEFSGPVVVILMCDRARAFYACQPQCSGVDSERLPIVNVYIEPE